MNQNFQHSTLQPVPMLDFSREFAAIREEVLAAIEKVCASQRFILGPEVERFEQEAAAVCDVPFAVGCSSGTDALWLAMTALGVGPGHSVITTPFSFFATASAILRAGATPIFADIEELTFNLDPAKVSEALHRAHLTAAGTKAAALLPVHLYGQCADMDELNAVARDHGLKVIEDAAQAFGAKWNGTYAGALSDAAAFSFYPTKNLSAYGDAGMLTTRDADTDERLRMLRAHGMRRRYFHDEVGWNCRLDSIQAAVLEVKLKRVAAGNERRRELAALYEDSFVMAGLAGGTTRTGVVLPMTHPRAEHVFHQYVIRAPRRDELRDFLTQHKIGTEIYYPLPLHLQESLQMLGYRRGDFPVSERAADEVLALPIYPELRDDEVATVVEAVRRFYA
ncbi:MAG TPA: DegT/DnrJ/EryC1/StrS family aminotransferase [Acidobacteriaceae bacterium]|jgi:dTDP-4-amino-4,6-dideoxygalactose transaminase